VPTLELYKAGYPRENYEYRPYDEFIKLITDLAAARMAGNGAVRQYFMKYWDVPLLTIYAVRNWAGVWDDTHHNMLLYKRPSTGKWIPFQQDFDWDFGLGQSSYDLARWHLASALRAHRAVGKTEKLAAITSRPTINLVLYHGVLA